MLKYGVGILLEANVGLVDLWVCQHKFVDVAVGCENIVPTILGEILRSV